MSGPNDSAETTYDVMVTSVPDSTPDGEPFASAVARAFGVTEDVGARVVGGTRAKRATLRAPAEAMRQLLESLGATVELVPREATSPVSVPPEATSRPARTSLPAAPQRPTGPSARPPLGPFPPLRPMSPPPPQTYGAPLPIVVPDAATRGAFLPPAIVRVVLVAAAMAATVLFVRWLKGQSDERQLGNAAKGESRCINKDCLAMLGLDRTADSQAKMTLVVAWRDGCLDGDYGAFLDGLQAKYGNKGLRLVGAGLGVPFSNDPRALALRPTPPPAIFPPPGCEKSYSVVPTRSGFIEDFFNQPATYLYDENGYLMAVWKAGMSPPHCDALGAFLDHKL
jgi:hypothetical protein